MGIIKKFKAVLIVVVPIITLVLFRSLSHNHFKIDAAKWAAPSSTGSNIITADKLKTLTGNILLINLDSLINRTDGISTISLKMPPDSILLRKNFNIIRNHAGPVLLCSANTDVAARIWMILSQMGVSNLYIMASETDNEVFKSKFRPDTITLPEF